MIKVCFIELPIFQAKTNLHKNSEPDTGKITSLSTKDLNDSIDFREIERFGFAEAPPCQLSKEPLSAIRRAKTSFCKNLFTNISCAIREGVFYARSLPDYCDTGWKNVCNGSRVCGINISWAFSCTR